MAAPGLTVGVEEEFLLMDRSSRNTVSRAAKVLSNANNEGPHARGANIHAELAATQVEASTGVCHDLADIHQHLQLGRQRLAKAAQLEDAVLISTGTPVLADSSSVTSVGERFETINNIYRGVVTGYQACGCHVHLGISDRETAIAVINHLRPWLPTLLALSVNSPFDKGKDSGYGSWRMIQQARFPGAGIPPWFDSVNDYEKQIERLVDCGILIDQAMSFWLARLSSRYPTIEVRAADACGTADEAALQAALTRGLVQTALTDLARGNEAPKVDEQIAAAAVWSAARYGLDGMGINLWLEKSVTAKTLLMELLAHITPELDNMGDLELVNKFLNRVLTVGTGADRQRRALAMGSTNTVVDMLANQTLSAKL